MRTKQLNQADWQKIDNELRRRIRRVLNLPAKAANEYLYGNSKDGLFGIPVTAEDSYIARIDSAFKLLNSPDNNVKKLAFEDLRKTVELRLKRPPSPLELSQYMSGFLFEEFTVNAYSNVWTSARLASTQLEVAWSFLDDDMVSISIGDVAVTDRRKVFKTFRNLLRSDKSAKLMEKKHQGKTFPCFSADKASTHFHRTGDFLRFRDWRFVHQARLGVVPLNAYSFVEDKDRSCRVCGSHPETLPHVLNHCRPNMPNIRKRHDRIVDRIFDAAEKCPSKKWEVLHDDEAVGPNGLRPDIVLHHGNDEVLLIDVACPFENGPEAFAAARLLKEQKYHHLIKYFQRRFKVVRVEAVIVGSLGSWDKRNDKILLRLCSKKYLHLMKKLCVSDCIRASRNIFMGVVSKYDQNEDNRSNFRRKRTHNNINHSSEIAQNPENNHSSNSLLFPSSPATNLSPSPLPPGSASGAIGTSTDYD